MQNRRLLFIVFSLQATIMSAQADRTFEFGHGIHAAHSTVIAGPVRYNSQDGYGFDFENTGRVIITEKKGTGFCTSEASFCFSVRVPEGTYEVSMRIGNPRKRSVTTIKAEARRLFLLNHHLKKGESELVSFIVNVRSPQIEGSDSIRLKPREYYYMNWDDRLTMEFSGRNQAVQSVRVRPVKKITTIFLAGNSTVTDQDLEPWASWGQMITRYFDHDIAVSNFAESGESLASFKGSGRLRKVLSLIEPGDYLFIEFGHNDQKRRGEGIGPWTSFSNLLAEFAIRAREKGAIPVFITPTQRRSFDDSGRITLTHGDYPAAMRKVAGEMGIPLIDLNRMTKILYEAWGIERSKKAFVHYPAGTFPGQTSGLKDNTHFNAFGAHEIALCILKGIIDLDLPLKDHIMNYPGEYDPARPTDPEDWTLPESPRYISKKP
jgi:lysophospholipase L1-like esterase